MRYDTKTNIEILEMNLKYQQMFKKSAKKFILIDIFFFIATVIMFSISSVKLKNINIVLMVIAISTVTTSLHMTLNRYHESKREIDMIKNIIRTKKILEGVENEK